MAGASKPPADLLAITPENLARLRAELERIEKSRGLYYKRLIAGYMSALLAIPLLIVALAVAGKYGLLAFLKPAWTTVSGWFAGFRWPGNYRSRRALNKAIVYIVGLVVMAPITISRSRLRKRYSSAIIPIVFAELGIPHTSPGTLKLDAVKTLFHKKPTHTEVPLTVNGIVGGLPFVAHLATVTRLEQRWYSDTPELTTLFEGVIVDVVLPAPAPVQAVLTFEKTHIADTGLTAVPLADPRHEAAFSIYANLPSRVQTFLNPRFLDDLMAFHHHPADLPPMEINLKGRSLILFIPARRADWLANCRLSMNAGTLEPIYAMLKSWRMLHAHIALLKTYHPELWAAPAPSGPVITRRRA